MEAIEFIKEYRRMCRKKSCSSCKIFNTEFGFCGFEGLADSNPELLITLIKEWSNSHPQKTMKQDFFEKFPNAPKTENGTPRNICPSDCGYTNEPESYIVCEHFTDDCLKCWSRPLGD